MLNKIKAAIYILILITGVIAGCERLNPPPPIPGIDESITLDGISFTVKEARIRKSYSTFYIMVYPPENSLFYAITANIEGFEKPQQAVEWGKNNLVLSSGESKVVLENARRILIGEDIQYKSGEDFEYLYEFIYTIEANSEHDSYKLVLPNDVLIPLDSILVKIKDEIAIVESDELESVGTEMVGYANTSSGKFATVNGGSHNISSAYYTTVGGGHLNLSTSAYGTAGGGRENIASGLYSTVSGGYGNLSSGRDATIGGGSRNSAENYHATIPGGIRNLASASDTTVSGGAYNVASDTYASVGGGTQNEAGGSGSVVSGGAGNAAISDMGTIGGGLGNLVDGVYATVAGGNSNKVSGDYSAIPGGSLNHAGGDFGFASGFRSVIQPEHDGVFLFADSTNAEFSSLNKNEFGVRSTGGARFITGVDEIGIPISGVIIPPGGGSWSNLSDRGIKDNFRLVNKLDILDSVAQLSISEWNYISQDKSIRHVGPVAQDFYAAFNIGEDNHYINTADADGIALASIQGLYQLVQEKEYKITILESGVHHLEKQLITVLISTGTLFIITTISFLGLYIRVLRLSSQRISR